MLRKSMIFLFFYLGISWASFAQEPGDLEASLVVVENIELIGNKVTVDKILYREITIRPGDTLTKADFLQGLKESQENLMNTSLFNFVTIHEEITNNGALIHYAVKIEVIERWYIWPLPIFELAERNFNAWWETKDLEKINYGLFLNWENFRGRKEHLKLLLQFGYDEKLGVSYSIPYIDKRQTIGVMFGFNQTKNHEVSYITTDNQVQRVRLDDYALIDYHGFLAFSHRANIYQTHHIETSYNDKNFADTVFQLNPVFYQGESNRAQFIKLSYFFKNDHRDYKTYPLEGYYMDVLLEKQGFGFFEGNEINVFVAKANIRKFWKFNKRLFFASGFTGSIANDDKRPYFLNNGIGYGRDYVRGYEYYVVDGQSFGLLKTDLKFAIIPQQVTTLKFIPTDKFNKIPWAVYLSLFSDAAYVSGNGYNGNNLQNQWLVGYGLGLNLVTYYDMVFRVEYSFNRMGEGGVFIHFMASI